MINMTMCSECKGTGKVGYGAIREVIYEKCVDCGGIGRIMDVRCISCDTEMEGWQLHGHIAEKHPKIFNKPKEYCDYIMDNIEVLKTGNNPLGE